MPSQYPGERAPRHGFAIPVSAPQTLKYYHFYGQETLAKLAARFIKHLFSCPDYPPSSTHSQAELPFFIAYILHRTKLHTSVTISALVLLKRLKARLPSSYASSGHQLFLSAYMISSKAMCDDAYSNKSWHIIVQHIFTPREVNQMEREMCTYLDWELTVDDPILANFEKAVKADFGEEKSEYPNYPTTFVSKRAARVMAWESISAEKSNTTNPVPGLGNDKRPVRQEINPGNTHGVDTSPGFGCVEGVPEPHPLKSKMSAISAFSRW